MYQLLTIARIVSRISRNTFGLSRVYCIGERFKMTGRRSTRAGSKDPTPAPAATPRRTTRRAGSATGTPLPAVNTRESTSYGSSVAVLPLPIQRYSDEKDLATTLAEILKPVKESIQARQQHQTTGEGPNPSLLHATVPVTPAAPQSKPVPFKGRELLY